jgi:hypothetical protein
LEYKRLIVQEAAIDGVVSYENMLHVTDREIAAGRMSEDYALRAIAIEECPEAARTSGTTTLEVQAPSANKLARLKHWLHSFK